MVMGLSWPARAKARARGQLAAMPQFCDVAVPVPLDATFTYRIPENARAFIGGRVIVPFREKRLCGIVTELHDRKPKFTTRRLSQVLDSTPALTPELMQLGSGSRSTT